LPLENASDGTLPRSRPDPPTDILFVGRLVDVKGADYLIRAVREAEGKLNRKLRLTLAGDGADRQKLEALARSCGIRAEFLGWVTSRRRDELFQSAHVLAAPSLWPEPFGLIGIEGGRFGLPAVGYAVGGIPDWLIPGVSGELADGNPPTVSGLAEAIVRALRDPEHYRELSEGAIQVSRRHGFAEHVAKLEEILRAQFKPDRGPSSS
jgi:glycosyltransferase involved in cell wall biosynthesis